MPPNIAVHYGWGVEAKSKIPAEWIELGRRGAFTTTQVASLIGKSSAQVTSWLDGQPPLIHSDFHPVAGRRALSFDGLVEARAIAFLLGAGVPRRKLGIVMQAMRRRYSDPHPLARERFITTDGVSVLEIEDGNVIDLLQDAYLHPEVIRSAIAGRVVFKSGRAAWLEPFPDDLPLVRIDPARAFGRPVVVDLRATVPTETLSNSAKLEGVADAADWFGISEDGVLQAVQFEHRLAA